MKQRVSIHLTTVQTDAGTPELFDNLKEEFSEIDFGEPPDAVDEQFEIFAQGTAEVTDGKFILSYDETELTGMEGARTALSFAVGNRDCVTMVRSGSVSTALTFVRGKRHISTYDTGVMPFSLCIYTHTLKNSLTLGGGTLEIDYLVEIRGAHAERNHLVLKVNRVEE